MADTKSDTRYPYTYACDLMRMATSRNPDGLTVSRSDASAMREVIAKALGMDDHELACKLADYFKAQRKKTAGEFVVTLPYGAKIHPIGKPHIVYTRVQTGWHNSDGWWRASSEVDEAHPEGMVEDGRIPIGRTAGEASPQSLGAILPEKIKEKRRKS